MRKFENYEQVAQYLLNKFKNYFGLSEIQKKQKIRGLNSKTEWEIDAKGVCENNIGFIIIECRRYLTSKQNQEKIGALAYKIKDTGAQGGIIVSPLGLQKGAKKIAQNENIINVILDPNSTYNDFALQFLNKIMLGLSDTIHFSDEVKVIISK